MLTVLLSKAASNPMPISKMWKIAGFCLLWALLAWCAHNYRAPVLERWERIPVIPAGGIGVRYGGTAETVRRIEVSTDGLNWCLGKPVGDNLWAFASSGVLGGGGPVFIRLNAAAVFRFQTEWPIEGGSSILLDLDAYQTSGTSGLVVASMLEVNSGVRLLRFRTLKTDATALSRPSRHGARS